MHVEGEDVVTYDTKFLGEREGGEEDEEPGVVVQMGTRVAPEIRHVPNNKQRSFIIFG